MNIQGFPSKLKNNIEFSRNSYDHFMMRFHMEDSYEFHMNFSWFFHDVTKLALIHFIFDKSISIYHEFDMNISCAGIWGRVHMKFIWNSYEGSSFMRFSRQSGHFIWISYEIHELLVFVFAGTWVANLDGQNTFILKKPKGDRP